VVHLVDNHRGLIRTVLTLPFIVLFGYLSLSEPTLNWDMIAYVANAIQYSGDSTPAEIQQFIFTQLPHSVPPEDLAKFTNTPNRLVLSTNPEAFNQTIHFFYDARVVYIGALALLMNLGMDPFFASYFISMCFSIPFVALACGLLDVARFSSPDSLATFVIISMYWLLNRNYLFALLLLLPMSIFVRTDLVILMPMFLGYLYILNRYSRLLIVLSGLATLAAYIVLNQFIVNGDPWSSLIGYNFGNKPTHPADFSFTVTFGNYVTYLIDGIKSFSYNPLFFMFCALAVTGGFMFGSRFFFNPNNQPVSRQHLDLLFLLVSCVAYVGFHFLLFPVTWIRFFAAQYSLVTVVVLWATLSILAERNYSNREEVDLMAK